MTFENGRTITESVGRVDDLGVGEMRLARVGDNRLVVARTEAGTFALDNAEANSGAFLSVGFHNSPPPFPQSLNAFGHLGLTNCYQWHDALATLFKPTNATGQATHDFPLPNVSTFDGMLMFSQWFQIQASGDVTASNYTRVIIGADTP